MLHGHSGDMFWARPSNRRPPVQTSGKLERLHVSAGQTPWESSVELEKVVRERNVWASLLRLLPPPPPWSQNQISDEIRDGTFYFHPVGRVFSTHRLVCVVNSKLTDWLQQPHSLMSSSTVQLQEASAGGKHLLPPRHTFLAGISF